MRGRAIGVETEVIVFSVAWVIGLLILIAVLNALTSHPIGSPVVPG